MPQKKKLQVFISSTFNDLQEERQAAVSAILTAGHIPAGMELFTAGDESQMQVIKRWIDESDVYLLILGSRYGSIEPISGKSYTQLEYEYAIEKGKPFFAVAIKDAAIDKRMKKGRAFVEMDNQALLNDFRSLVISKVVRFWDDIRDIKIAILETIADFSRRGDLIGWIPGNEAIDGGALAEEIARLAKENNELRQQLLLNIKPEVLYNTLTFYEMIQFLKMKSINIDSLKDLTVNTIETIHKIFKGYDDKEFTVFHAFIIIRNVLASGSKFNTTRKTLYSVIIPLKEAGLVEMNSQKSGSTWKYYELTEIGRQFLLRLKLEQMLECIDVFFKEYYESNKVILPTVVAEA